MSKIEKSQFVKQFKASAREYLQQLTHALLAAEKSSQNREQLEVMMRTAHTLKGSAAMMGYKHISELAHKVEDGLEAAMEGKIQLGKDHFSLLFQALDLIEAMLDEKAMRNNKGILEDLLLRTCQDLDQMFRPQPASLPKDPGTMPVAAVSTAAGSPFVHLEEDLIWVETRQLNKVSNLTSEVFVAVRRIKEMVASLSSQVTAANVPAHSFYDLLQGFRQLDDQLRDLSKKLQDEVLNLRMVPVAYLFDTFPRAMRDLANSQGKDIALNVSGEETQWDKAIMDEVRELVLHLLRNAVDHGIESPEIRRAKGKPEQGQVRLSAYREGAHLVLEVQDDGAGISLQRIRETAVRKNLAEQAQVNSCSTEQLYALLFHAGFSTKEKVSEVSGRGVGLNVVREAVARLKGRVEVKSQEGQGTSFILRLPLTLAITENLLAMVGSEVFAIPVENIVETTRIDPSQIIMDDQKETIQLPGKLLPLVRLHDIFGLPRKGVMEKRHLPVVVVQGIEKTIGIAFDELLGRQEILCKSLGAPLQEVPFIAGATILSSGRVSLILDIHAIIEAAEKVPIKNAGLPLRSSGVRGKKILVAEDVFPTALMEKEILESMGYAVVIARDGKEALGHALQEHFDAVITDVLMPQMDGFELIAALRKQKNYRDVPIIVLTTRQSEADKRRGLEAGADAYLLKDDFTADLLVDTLERLLE